GDRCCLIVTDLGSQSGDEHQASLKIVFDSWQVRLYALCAKEAEVSHRVRQQLKGAQYIVRDERLEDVQLKVAAGSRDPNRDVVSHDLRADHGESFTLGWVDFSGHD